MSGQRCLGFLSLSPKQLPGHFALGVREGLFLAGSNRHWHMVIWNKETSLDFALSSVLFWAKLLQRSQLDSFLSSWVFSPLGQSHVHFEFTWGPPSESRIRIVRPYSFFFFFFMDCVVFILSIFLCLCELTGSIWK